MWAEAGITNVTLRNVEGKVRTQMRNDGDFDITMGGWTGDYLDPLTFLDLFTTGNPQNAGRYSNPEFDAQVQLAKETIEDEARYEALHKAEDILMEDIPFLVVTSEPRPYLQNDKLKGDIRNAIGTIDLKYAYLEA